MMDVVPDLPCDPDAVSPYLLIGNELSLYRDVLAGAVAARRPTVPVRVVPASSLDATVVCWRPWLVICSEVTPIIEDLVSSWVLLHPDGYRHTVVSVAGERRTVPHPTLDELVRLVDEVWKVTAG